MLNQTTQQIETMWISTTQTHRDVMKYEGVWQRRIYWDLNKAILMMVTVATLVIGVVGNVMVLLTVCIRRLMQNPMSYYLASLAAAHTVLSLVVCPFLTFHTLRDVHYRREVCAAFYILLYSMALLVALGVFTIGVDRVWKEIWSWHYLSGHSGRLALAVVAGCWTAVLVLVTALELTGSAQHPLRQHICPGDGGAATPRLQTTALGDVAIELILYACYAGTFVCLVTVQVLYGRKTSKTGHLPGALTGDALVQVPEKEADSVRETGGKLAPRLNKHLYEDGDQEARSVRLLLLLVSLHTVCWLPFYLLYSLTTHGPPALVPYHIVEIIHYLALLSSPLSPLLFYFSSVEFNSVMRQLAATMCCRAASIASGSTVTLEWEPVRRISDDQMEAFDADGDRLSIGATPTPSEGLVAMKSDVGISVRSSLGSRTGVLRELVEIEVTGGPSSELFGRQHLPPLSPKRSRTRPSTASQMGVGEARIRPSTISKLGVGDDGLRTRPSTASQLSVEEAGPRIRPSATSQLRVAETGFVSQSPTRITVGITPPPETPVITKEMTSPLTSHVPSPDRRGEEPGGGSPAAGKHPGRSLHVIANLRNLFRRGRPGSSRPDSAAATPDRGERRGLAARVAALWHRRRQTGPGRTTSEESLVRRLVAAGLPSGVVAARDRRRLSGVWRSPGGRLHRLDPESEQYPALLERIAAADSGYRTPAGQRIHHVCALHHVHGRCHHHDARRAAVVGPQPTGPRQQTSVGNWTAPSLVVERPVRQLLPPPAPPRLGSASSTDSEDIDTVKRITDL